jgi:mannosyltransferase
VAGVTALAPSTTGTVRRARRKPVAEPRDSKSSELPGRRTARSAWLDPVLLGALTAGISSLGSWIPSKWNDEAATQTAASRTLPQLWQMMQNIDAVHGTYYAFMHFWIIAFGTSNFALRAPSMIAVGGACAGVVVLGKRLGTRRIAICSAAVFMVLPRVTWMAIEARSYAFTALVAVWLTVVLLHAVDRRRNAWWAMYTVLAALGVMLNVYLALLVLAHGVALLVSRRRYPRARSLVATWAISSTLAAVIAWPIVRLVLGEGSQLPFGPLQPSGVANTLLVGAYFVGATPTFGRGVPVPPTSLWATTAIILACVGWALMIAPVLWRRLRPAPHKDNSLTLLAVTGPWIVVPFALIIGFSLIATPIYTGRYFSFTTPAVALLIGTSIATITSQWKRALAIAAFAVIALPIFLSQREPTSKNDTDWQQAAAIIQSHAKPGQDIYYGPVRAGSKVSTSKVRDAYPTVLADLHDITLKRTGVQNSTLWDSQWPLADARGVLRTTPLLWVVLEHYGTPSPGTTEQEKYIESNGLHLDREWRGPSTDVLLFTR